MKIVLSKKENEYLKQSNINIDSSEDLTEDEAFALVDRIRDEEIFYAQDSDKSHESKELAKIYGDISDKIQNMIP